MNIHLGKGNSASSHRQISREILHYVKLGVKSVVKLGVKLQREIMLPQAGERFSRSVFGCGLSLPGLTSFRATGLLPAQPQPAGTIPPAPLRKWWIFMVSQWGGAPRAHPLWGARCSPRRAVRSVHSSDRYTARGARTAPKMSFRMCLQRDRTDP